MDPERAATRRGRHTRLWFDLHSWFGIVTGLLLFVICWSGTFATVAHEIDWLLNPAQRVEPAGPPAAITEVHELVRAAYPQAAVEAIYPPLYDRFAYNVLIVTANEQRRHVYVDPYRLAITGDAPFLNVQRYLRDLHRRLFVGGPGLYLVCLMSIPLLASLVTSVLFYRGWWRKFFSFRPGRNLRGWISNLHSWLGLWTLWFVLVIGITGTWYLWEALRADAMDGKFSHVDASPSAVHPLPPVEADGRERLSFEALLAAARAVRPELDIGYLYTDRNGYFYVTGQAGHLLVRHRANNVFVDAYSGEVIYSQAASGLSPYWRWSDTADPLHFGDFGGLISKGIWFVFGLVLSFLSISGAWLFARRLARNRRYRRKARTTLAATGVAAALVSIAAPLPLAFLDRVGPTVAGTARPAELLPGVWLFILAWVAITILVALSWLVMLWRPLQHAGSNAAQAGSRVVQAAGDKYRTY